MGVGVDGDEEDELALFKRESPPLLLLLPLLTFCSWATKPDRDL